MSIQTREDSTALSNMFSRWKIFVVFFPPADIWTCHHPLSNSTLKIIKKSTTSHLKFNLVVDNIL